MRHPRLALSLAAVLLLAAAPALTACSLQTVVKDATGGNVDLGGNSVPSDFPQVVPLIDGEIVLGAGVGTGSSKVWNVTVKVSGPEAYQDIQTQLTDAGFDGQFGVQGPNGGGTGTFSGNGYGVAVVVTDAGTNGWVANYSVSPTGTTPTPSS